MPPGGPARSAPSSRAVALTQHRDLDPELSAAEVAGGDVDRATVAEDDGTRDGEAEADAVSGAARRVGAVEALEDAGALRLGDPGAVVGDGDGGRGAVPGRAHADVGRSARELAGVLH